MCTRKARKHWGLAFVVMHLHEVAIPHYESAALTAVLRAPKGITPPASSMIQFAIHLFVGQLRLSGGPSAYGEIAESLGNRRKASGPATSGLQVSSPCPENH